MTFIEKSVKNEMRVFMVHLKQRFCCGVFVKSQEQSQDRVVKTKIQKNSLVVDVTPRMLA